MRLLALLAALLTAAFVAVGLATARQDDEAQDERRTLLDFSQAEREQLRARAFELAIPVEQHGFLKRYAGTFDLEIKLWAQPGVAPATSKGTAVHEAVLGGRFLRMTTKSNLMGMDVESIQYWGFDRRTQEFTSIGFDTMGTYSVTASGQYDPATTTLTLSGTDEGLGFTQVYDQIVELVDDDTMKSSYMFHDMVQPGPFKMMEIISRRRKE